jgi:TonB family protein
MECYAPAEGIYGKQRALPPAQKEAVERYMFAVIHQLDVEWKSHMPRAASDPWVKGKTVAVRFAIKPDGTIDDPVVTLASGRRSYDNHALDAVLNSAPFPPLPEGVRRPVPICMRFGYNTDPGAKKSEMPDLWPPPAKPQPKTQPAEGGVNSPANNPSGSQPK